MTTREVEEGKEMLSENMTDGKGREGLDGIRMKGSVVNEGVVGDVLDMLASIADDLPDILARIADSLPDMDISLPDGF